MKYELTDFNWDDEERNAILEVLDSKRITMGEKTIRFEKEFANYFGAKYAVMVNSGSSANLLAIASLIYSGKLNRGDEVIVPAISWSTTYYPLYQYGLRIKFIDVDLDTLNIDCYEIEKNINDKTKAIFVVNLLGNPNNFDELKRISNAYNLLLIEDDCEAMGARFNDKYTGTFGILGTFSSFYSHHINTIEGGMVVTNDQELYLYLKSLRAHGWTRDLPQNSKLYKKSGNPFYEYFNFILPGYNLRPTEIQAAIGLKQLEKLGKFLHERRENAKYFQKLFSNQDNLIIQGEIGESSWFGFSIILRNELEGKRDSLVYYLNKKGVEVRPIVAGNFVKNSVIKYFNYEIPTPLSNSDYIHENGFFVGNKGESIIQELDYLFSIFGEFIFKLCK